jgi:hypothetical protein
MATTARKPTTADYEKMPADGFRHEIADVSAKTVEVREFGSPRRTRAYQDDQSFQSEVLPGLTIPLESLFSF